MIAITGVPVWVLIVAIVATFVVTIIASHKAMSDDHKACNDKVKSLQKEMDGYHRAEFRSAVYDYNSDGYWHHRYALEQNILKLNEENARLLEKNNRVIKRNRELKRVFGINSDAIKYVVLKGEKLDIIGE